MIGSQYALNGKIGVRAQSDGVSEPHRGPALIFTSMLLEGDTDIIHANKM